jgi:hypothetical protein
VLFGPVPVQNLPRAGRILHSSKLADVFGIDLGSADPKPSHKPVANKRKPLAPRADKSANCVSKQSARKKSGKTR